MRSWIRRHPAVSYFTLAFAISWGGILTVIRGGATPAPPDEARQLFLFVYLAMLAGPTVAGLTMTLTVDGIAGLHEYRARLLRWRVAPIWYAVAALTAPIALGLTMRVLSQFSSDFIPAILSAGPIDPAGPIAAPDAHTLLLLAVLVGFGAGFFEELGWTGFAIPVLLKRLGVVRTGLAVGLTWGAWHFLAVWWGSASSFESVPVPLFLLVALFTFLPPYRVLMVHVYQSTGSLLVGVLMHASLTTSMILLGPPINGIESVTYNLVFAMTLWLIVALALGIDRWRSRLADSHEQRPILWHRPDGSPDAQTPPSRSYRSTHHQRRRVECSDAPRSRT